MYWLYEDLDWLLEIRLAYRLARCLHEFVLSHWQLGCDYSDLVVQHLPQYPVRLDLTDFQFSAGSCW